MEELTEKGLDRSLQAQFSTVKAVPIPEAIANSQMLSALGVDRVMPRQVGTGTYRGEQAVGSQNVRIDSTGRRILISDDVNIRVVLGKVR